MSTRRTALLAVVAAALVAATAAQAHVTPHPNALPSGGGDITMWFTVPNEMSNANTTKLDVQFPDGFIGLDPEPVPGWKSKVVEKKLPKPIQTDDGPISFEVAQVIWTATAGGLPPGEAVRLFFTTAVPGKPAGTTLTFKALQTYSNGKIVRWIGPPSADQPAPQVVLIGADSATADYPGGVDAIKKALAAGKAV